MRIKAGMLDRRATFFAPVNVRNTTNGETTQTWQDRGMRWCSVLRLLPSEMNNDEQLIAKAGVKLLVHLDTLTRAIAPTWRVAYDGTTYDVTGTEPTQRDGSQIVYIVGLPS